MRFVRPVSFSVLFSGDKLESFRPTRGIRQGDPISPYLFLLAVEGLSCLLKSRIQSSMLKGITVAPSAPMVNHLLFTDDSLLVFSSKSGECFVVEGGLTVILLSVGTKNQYGEIIHTLCKGC
jgi:hypothetical protein